MHQRTRKKERLRKAGWKLPKEIRLNLQHDLLRLGWLVELNGAPALKLDHRLLRALQRG